MKTNPLAKRQENFCRNTFRMKGFDIQWFTLTGIVQLSHNRIAELHLSMAQPNTYKSISVNIRHKVTGPLGHQSFYFKDYLKTAAKETERVPDFYVQDECPSFPSDHELSKPPKFDWVRQPADISELMAPIEAYIKAWE